MIIAPETEKDIPKIYNFIKKAFETAKFSDGKEQDFTNALRQSEAYVPELALTLKDKDEIIGFIMLTKFYLKPDKDSFEVLLLAPLCIDEKHRNKGFGGELIGQSLKKAALMGFKAVILLGDPDYYSKYGFKEAASFGITNNEGIAKKFIMAKELSPNALKNLSATVSFH